MLGPGDPLPDRPRRVLVAGTSGSGKTTLAGRVSLILDLPHTEIDGLYHGQGWIPREGFVTDVQRFSAEPAWVTEWQYGAVRGLLAERADLLIWLDLPRRVVMTQVIYRTVRRRLRRELLWNGNQEGPLRKFFTDPEHVVRYAWSAHPQTAPRVRALHEQRPELPIVRLSGRAEIDRWYSGALSAVVNR